MAMTGPLSLYKWKFCGTKRSTSNTNSKAHVCIYWGYTIALSSSVAILRLTWKKNVAKSTMRLIYRELES
ncbi:hypothetical protein TWF694_011563 [Orbilia ellipsospora]|uniref:Uncharacterized protein n=1 Tax=Orbilia ellipsospora TaxID=2528407 RepID=A0AAV9X6U8_9PEZI